MASESHEQRKPVWHYHRTTRLHVDESPLGIGQWHDTQNSELYS